jgi:hypothetical protein
MTKPYIPTEKKGTKRAVLTALSLLSASLGVSGSAAKETYPETDSNHATALAAGTPVRFAKMQSNQQKSQLPSSSRTVTSGESKTKGSSKKQNRVYQVIKIRE